MGPDAMILVFWVLSFKPTFSLSSFTFIKRLFSSSLSAIGWCHLHIWGYWYLSQQSWFQLVLLPAQLDQLNFTLPLTKRNFISFYCLIMMTITSISILNRYLVLLKFSVCYWIQVLFNLPYFSTFFFPPTVLRDNMPLSLGSYICIWSMNLKIINKKYRCLVHKKKFHSKS